MIIVSKEKNIYQFSDIAEINHKRQDDQKNVYASSITPEEDLETLKKRGYVENVEQRDRDIYMHTLFKERYVLRIFCLTTQKYQVIAVADTEDEMLYIKAAIVRSYGREKRVCDLGRVERRYHRRRCLHWWKLIWQAISPSASAARKRIKGVCNDS